MKSLWIAITRGPASPWLAAESPLIRLEYKIYRDLTLAFDSHRNDHPRCYNHSALRHTSC